MPTHPSPASTLDLLCHLQSVACDLVGYLATFLHPHIAKKARQCGLHFSVFSLENDEISTVNVALEVPGIGLASILSRVPGGSVVASCTLASAVFVLGAARVGVARRALGTSPKLMPAAPLFLCSTEQEGSFVPPAKAFKVQLQRAMVP